MDMKANLARPWAACIVSSLFEGKALPTMGAKLAPVTRRPSWDR